VPCARVKSAKEGRQSGCFGGAGGASFFWKTPVRHEDEVLRRGVTEQGIKGRGRGETHGYWKGKSPCSTYKPGDRQHVGQARKELVVDQLVNDWFKVPHTKGCRTKAGVVVQSQGGRQRKGKCRDSTLVNGTGRARKTNVVKGVYQGYRAKAKNKVERSNSRV